MHERRAHVGMGLKSGFHDMGVDGLAVGEAVELGAGFEGEREGVGVLRDAPLAHFSKEGQGLSRRIGEGE